MDFPDEWCYLHLGHLIPIPHRVTNDLYACKKDEKSVGNSYKSEKGTIRINYILLG